MNDAPPRSHSVMLLEATTLTRTRTLTLPLSPSRKQVAELAAASREISDSYAAIHSRLQQASSSAEEV